MSTPLDAIGCVTICVANRHHDFKMSRKLYEALAEDMLKHPTGVVLLECGHGDFTYRLGAIDSLEYSSSKFMVETASDDVVSMTTLTRNDGLTKIPGHR
jgi:hypothetical protein